MILSGIADEAGRELATQIKAQHSIGWTHIDIRNLPDGNLAEVDDTSFDAAYGQLQDAGMQVLCFASRVGCGARDISNDFSEDQADLARAIPRMQKLGCRYLRCMSWPNREHKTDSYWRREAIRRLRILSQMAADAGVVLAHENCSGWGGKSPENCLTLLHEVDSPGFELIFDIANPITRDGSGAWEFWQGIKEHVSYIHVKDRLMTDTGMQHCWPGDGVGRVREILQDAFNMGFDGPIAIEPHMSHLNRDASDAEKFNNYVSYGQKLNALIKSIADQPQQGASAHQ